MKLGEIEYYRFLVSKHHVAIFNSFIKSNKFTLDWKSIAEKIVNIRNFTAESRMYHSSID
jgi:hypothetical protein